MSTYTQTLTAPAEFAALATATAVPGMGQVAEVKFLITGVRTDHPTLWLFDTQAWPYHFVFARDGLGFPDDLRAFNAGTYFTPHRDQLAGSVVRYDHVTRLDGGAGIYALEFWPGDPVGGPLVILAWTLLKAALSFPEAHLRYHPSSGTLVDLADADQAALTAAGVQQVETATLYAEVPFAPLNMGVGFGTLRRAEASGRPPTVRDVVVFDALPNDLSHVAGVLTAEPQTPLSHVNLKAKQNDTPNAFLLGAAEHPEVAPFFGQTVRFEVRADGFSLRPATTAEMEAHLEASRPSAPQLPPGDLAEARIQPLGALRNADLARYGAKAANLGELAALLPEGMVPAGRAVPFAAYDAFMRHNGLYTAAREMMAAPAFTADASHRAEALKGLRKRIKRGDLPCAWGEALAATHAEWPAGTALRCRSSTNNEDLQGFNGAGLYDSYTHRPDEGHLGKSIKQVWASLWTFRAFEERAFHRVDHFATYMGVAIHPNFDGERVNGVAVTRNIRYPQFEGYYLNNQVGESLVTNPEGGVVPEELLVGFLTPESGEYEVITLRRSSLSSEAALLSPAQLAALVDALRAIDAHFEGVYRAADHGFAMDVEYKITAEDRLVIKQARPWVD